MKETIITVIIALISSAGFWAFIGQKIEKRSAVNQALGALLRHEMFDIYEIYKEKDSVPSDILEEMDSLYQAYHALGFNNLGTKIHDEIMRKTAE